MMRYKDLKKGQYLKRYSGDKLEIGQVQYSLRQYIRGKSTKYNLMVDIKWYHYPYNLKSDHNIKWWMYNGDGDIPKYIKPITKKELFSIIV